MKNVDKDLARIKEKLDIDEENSGFFNSLRARSDLLGQISTEETHDLCDYLFWMEKNDIEVKF